MPARFPTAGMVVVMLARAAETTAQDDARTSEVHRRASNAGPMLQLCDAWQDGHGDSARCRCSNASTRQGVARASCGRVSARTRSDAYNPPGGESIQSCQVYIASKSMNCGRHDKLKRRGVDNSKATYTGRNNSIHSVLCMCATVQISQQRRRRAAALGSVDRVSGSVGASGLRAPGYAET